MRDWIDVGVIVALALLGACVVYEAWRIDRARRAALAREAFWRDAYRFDHVQDTKTRVLPR